MKAVGIIPVRLESSRLPEKALKDICGMPMIVHTALRAKLSKKNLEYLSYAGAFDSLEDNRNKVFNSIKVQLRL